MKALLPLFLVIALGGVAFAEDTTEAENVIMPESESGWQIFNRGGKLMVAIMLASVVALGFGIERGMALRGPVQTPEDMTERVCALVRTGNFDAAVNITNESEGVLSRVLQGVIARRVDGRNGMEDAASAIGYRMLYDIRKNIRPIGVVANVTPLMGLLGTVLGMITAFAAASAEGTERGTAIAGGIAEALLTTGAGLIVAIPALIAYQYFRSKTEDFVRASEGEAAILIDAILEKKAE